MSAWLMDNIWWFVAGLATLIIAIKLAIIVVFRRLAGASAEEGGQP